MLVTLIRHGQIPANIDRRYIGRTNQLLTDEGKRQAARAKVPEVDKVFVSPYTRCLQTADIMYPGMEHTEVEDLREMDFGIFENKTADEMVDFKPYRDWVDSMCEGPVPDGETMAEFHDRCSAAFENVIKSCDTDDRLAFVVHGGTIMAVMGAFNDEGRSYFEYHLENCQFFTCEVRWEPELKLHRVAGAEPGGQLPPKVEDK